MKKGKEDTNFLGIDSYEVKKLEDVKNLYEGPNKFNYNFEKENQSISN